MRKFFLSTIVIFCFTILTYAQEGFAVKAGLNNVTQRVDLGAFGGTVSDGELGFFVGGGYNFELDDTWDIEPSALLSFVNELTSLYIPVMAKYKFGEGFNVQAGPQLNILLEDVPDGAVGIDIAFGGGYQIDENWFVEGRFGIEVARGGDFGDLTSFNTLTLGGGYRFN